MERDKRFLYESDDVNIVKNQCKNCYYNENKPLSCKKFTRIPNGIRSYKITCPYRKSIAD